MRAIICGHVGKLSTGMSCNAVGLEHNVNESTVYLNKMSLNRNIKQSYVLIG